MTMELASIQTGMRRPLRPAFVSSSPQPVPVAFLITDLDPGGAERALVQIVTRLDRGRWQPSVVCLSRAGALVPELEAAGIPVTCLGARRGWQFPIVVRRLARELRRTRPEIVQTFLYHANVAGRIAGRLAGVPRVVSGIRVAEKRSRLRLWIDRWTDRLVDRHVCVSNDVARFSIDVGQLPADKVIVIPNGVDAERFANARPADLAQFGIPSGSRTLLFVGRLDPQKAPRSLMAAIEPLLDASKDVHLLLVGDGPLRSEVERVALSRNPGYVHFAGWRPDIPEIMRASYCLLLASRWEGLPNVVLEAMAAGLPVVSTDVEGISDLIEDGVTGRVVASGSPAAFREAVRGLLDDPGRAAAVAQAAQVIVRSDFTWATIASHYDSLFCSLLAK